MPVAWDRIVLHADMDAFYAQVEQLDNPALRRLPVLIGGAGGRGVVLTASYEARPFGVGSAMPMAEAKRRCPHAVIVPPRFERYMELSERIMGVFGDFSPTVQALSLDEAFIDMTGATGLFGAPEAMGKALKAAVKEATGLVVSVGASGTKYVAKVASDYGKPDGLLVVPQATARAFLAPLPVRYLWGAGPVTCEKLHALGLTTIGQVAVAPPDALAPLGSRGPHFQALARAVDRRPVVAGEGRGKSIGSERTLSSDIRDPASIRLHLRRSADEIGRRLRKKDRVAFGVRVKLKTSSFRIMTRQRRLPEPTQVADVLYRAGAAMLDDFDHTEAFRLVGLAAYDIHPARPEQLPLFDQDHVRHARLETALDTIRARFGAGAMFRAEDLDRPHRGRMAVNLDFLDDKPAVD